MCTEFQPSVYPDGPTLFCYNPFVGAILKEIVETSSSQKPQKRKANAEKANNTKKKKTQQKKVKNSPKKTQQKKAKNSPNKKPQKRKANAEKAKKSKKQKAQQQKKAQNATCPKRSATSAPPSAADTSIGMRFMYARRHTSQTRVHTYHKHAYTRIVNTRTHEL